MADIIPRMLDDWRDLQNTTCEIEFTSASTRVVEISMVIVDIRNDPIWVEAKDGRIYLAQRILSFRKLG